MGYAPKESALSQVNLTKMTEYVLWLLGADPLTHNANGNLTVNRSDTQSLHERLAFDILFEIDAHPEADQVRVLSRLLTILQFDAENQHNLKQYRVLCNKLLRPTVVTHKASRKYLQKVLTKLDKLEEAPTELLDADKLGALEVLRKRKVGRIQQELKDLLYLSDSEKRELEQELGIDLASESASVEPSVELAQPEKEVKRKVKKLRAKQNASLDTTTMEPPSRVSSRGPSSRSVSRRQNK